MSFPDPDEPAPAEAEGAESAGYSSVILVGCTVYMRTDIKSTDGLEGYAAAASVAKTGDAGIVTKMYSHEMLDRV